MATLYVSNTSSNGYAVGLDSNTYAQMQSKLTPALTLTGAVARLVSGDTIVINDGIYSEANYIAIGFTNITISAENPYKATIQNANAGDTRVINQSSSATGLTLGNIIIDARGVQSNCINAGSAAQLTLNGTKFINWTTNGVVSTNANLLITGDWVADTTTSTVSASIVYFTPAASGSLFIGRGVGSICSGAASGSTYGILAQCSSGIVSYLTMGSATINISATNPALYLQATSFKGFSTYDIGKNIINELSLQSAGGNYEGIYIQNSVNTTSKCLIYKNIINGGNPNPATNASGHNICIGEDASSSTYANSINGIFIFGNKCYSMNHQVIVAWVTRAILVGNICDNGVIGIVTKFTTNSLVSGNVFKRITTGGALFVKNGTNDTFTNNTVIITQADGVGINVNGATSATVNAKFQNNIISMDGVQAKSVMVQNDYAHTVSFANNNYYSNAGFSATAFAYRASAYADFAAWQVAQETSALNIDPEFVNYPDDLRVPPTSPLYHAGTYAGPDSRDFRGRPFYIKPTIGAYEVTARDMALPRAIRV